AHDWAVKIPVTEHLDQADDVVMDRIPWSCVHGKELSEECSSSQVYGNKNEAVKNSP
ncbi:hypothetical protein STEG23_013123, partial [Scotinomys teguina]